MGDGVKSIGDEAFANCTNLLSVTIGEGVESIGHRVFNECNNIVGIICKPATPPVTEHLTLANGVSIYVPDRKAYRSAIGWSMYAKHFKRLR